MSSRKRDLERQVFTAAWARGMAGADPVMPDEAPDVPGGLRADVLMMREHHCAVQRGTVPAVSPEGHLELAWRTGFYAGFYQHTDLGAVPVAHRKAVQLGRQRRQELDDERAAL